MALRFFQVDAFTDQPFSGNPAAVCLLESPANADWMQKVAAEIEALEGKFASRLSEAAKALEGVAGVLDEAAPLPHS